MAKRKKPPEIIGHNEAHVEPASDGVPSVEGVGDPDPVAEEYSEAIVEAEEGSTLPEMAASEDGESPVWGPALFTYPEMSFGKAAHHPGLNLSVRRGTKWQGASGPYLAMQVIEDPKSPASAIPFALIRIHDTLTIPFEELNGSAEVLLQFNHDPHCRNYYNLLREMRERYPTPTPTSVGIFQPSEDVTVVLFSVIEVVDDVGEENEVEDN